MSCLLIYQLGNSNMHPAIYKCVPTSKSSSINVNIKEIGIIYHRQGN